MAFRKLDKSAGVLPPRQWALVGYPGSGKSTFATQMAGPLLVVDSDHRFQEVARLAQDDVFEVSEKPEDHGDALAISDLLKENMKGSGVQTIVVDSLTSILSPLTVEAIMDNDAGRNKNRVAAFKDKALAMRLLQDSITGTGCNTLWIYHLRTGLDATAKNVESTTVSVVELARLRRSLNMQLRIIEENGRRGVKVEWARRGLSGMTLWDTSGVWAEMPSKIEQAVYAAGVKEAEEPRIMFAGPEDAIAWGYEQGCYRDAVHTKNSYAKLRTELKPKSAPEMWRAWIAKVEQHKSESVESELVAA
jgi:KaiC/GvpD/RAD55 family RecA-like ATPase